MSELSAIAGQLMSYRTLADGSLRITVDLPETESSHFHELFPKVHLEVAVARLNPIELAAAQNAAAQAKGSFGKHAQSLRVSGFCALYDVWRACGSDDLFLQHVRTLKCAARSGVPCEGDVQAAHVWRLKDGFGKGVKGPYAAIPLCVRHHGLQHSETEDAIGGREYMEAQRYQVVVQWAWDKIKNDIGVASMADASPAAVFAWAEKRGVERLLPTAYKEAA
jgi:hypothetical protein